MRELRVRYRPQLQAVSRMQARVPHDKHLRVRQRRRALARHRHPNVHLALLEHAVRVAHPEQEARLGYDHPRAELVLLLERADLRELRGADHPLYLRRLEPVQQEALRGLGLLQRGEDVEGDLPVCRRGAEPPMVVRLALEERLGGDAEAGEEDDDLVVEAREGVRDGVGDDGEGVAGRRAELLLARSELGDAFLVELRMEHQDTLRKRGSALDSPCVQMDCLITLYPLYLKIANQQPVCVRLKKYNSPDLEHARNVRPAMEPEPFPAAQKSGELGANEPTSVREVLAVEYDVFNVLGDLRVEVPVDLCFRKQETNTLRT